MDNEVANANGMDQFLPGEAVGEDISDKYLTFFVEEQIFGLCISNVTSIIQMQEITSMPELPYYVKGIISMRGLVIPIININLRFGKMEQEYTDRTCIIILEMGEHQVGVIVDAVEEVLDILPEDISPRPTLAGQSANYVTGIGKVGGKMVLLLDSHLLVGNDMGMFDMISSI